MFNEYLFGESLFNQSKDNVWQEAVSFKITSAFSYVTCQIEDIFLTMKTLFSGLDNRVRPKTKAIKGVFYDKGEKMIKSIKKSI